MAESAKTTLESEPTQPTRGGRPGHERTLPLEERAPERAIGSVPERAVFGEQLPETD
ncbi:hypothetical protein [Streptomyces profundus]|uniref:hypothetical protein n=1 Tax=Streptomyces profundus TaxID=2867410 RepID=UPI001D16A010|nr:hypothetical protein [Streptomyces sp. MA3_2.13]UED87683.1 hypothetical protein K4G22_28710 [Streptomyces sp. MA3_2.13]